MNQTMPNYRFLLVFTNAGNRHADIEKALGCKPTRCYMKGDAIDLEYLPNQTCSVDCWLLESPLSSDASAAEHFNYMSSIIENNQRFIRSLTCAGVMAEVRCILYHSEESFVVPGSVVATLSKCGMQLSIRSQPGTAALIRAVLNENKQNAPKNEHS
jgi:hypothetical protein